jgi:hypothetical protein
MTFQLDSLAKFTPERLDMVDGAGIVFGRLERRSRLREGWLVVLYAGDGQFVEGRLVSYDTETGEAQVQVAESTDLKHVETGKAYPALDSYWGERAELVADRTRVWHRTRFEPTAEWDHEHCEICWEKIAVYAQPFGFRDQQDAWVCEACYRWFVKPMSFDFLRDGLKDLVDGT